MGETAYMRASFEWLSILGHPLERMKINFLELEFLEFSFSLLYLVIWHFLEKIVAKNSPLNPYYFEWLSILVHLLEKSMNINFSFLELEFSMSETFHSLKASSTEKEKEMKNSDPTLNTQSCIRRPFCSTLKLENLRSPKRKFFHFSGLKKNVNFL